METVRPHVLPPCMFGMCVSVFIPWDFVPLETNIQAFFHRGYFCLFVFLRLHSNVRFICSATLYSAAGVRSVKSCFRLLLLQGTMTCHKSANLNRFGTQFTPRFQFFVDVRGQANSRCEEQDWQWKNSNQTCFEDEYL